MTKYSKTYPFLASLKKRVRLTGPNSSKKTQHLVLDLNGSGISYSVGDSIGVFPENSSEIVNLVLQALKYDGTESITDHRTGDVLSIQQFLSQRTNLSTVTKKLLGAIVDAYPDPASPKCDTLNQLLQPDQRPALKAHLAEYHVWDFLAEHPEANLSPEAVCQCLQPLLPRLYSIASSQKVVGDEVHLTVAEIEYESNGHRRHGTTTHWLCNIVPLNKQNVPIFIQPAHGFCLPSDHSTPLIMVGSGTGIAPFRAFMQERTCVDAAGPHWLFFGERTRENEYLYRDYWETLVKNKQLRIDTAFSRNQEQKIYVQHKMLEHGEELWHWLENGAHFYVCGDASQMAKDVDMALQHIVGLYGDLDVPATKAYLKTLRADGRYQKDVY